MSKETIEVTLNEHLDGEQYCKYNEFVTWLHYDRLKKRAIESSPPKK